MVVPIYGNFGPGSVVRIKLRDFLTYDEAEIKPGPKLNTIIGPNGTGKSTIVCALLLGLGGTPTMLGRSKQFHDYIKHGKDVATTEIELKGNDPHRRPFNPIIKMTISRLTTTKGPSYFIDNQKCTKDQVLVLAKGLNIQVNNPCQFLPQDKVVAFSQQNAQQLLENTERALDQNLLALHQQLKEQQGEGSNIKKNLENEQIERTRLANLVEELAPQVRAYQQREQYLKNIQRYTMKLTFLNYDESRKEFESSRDELAARKKELDVLEKPLAPLIKKIEQLKLERERIKGSVTKEETKQKPMTDRLAMNSEAIDSWDEKLNKARMEKDGAKAKRTKDLAIIKHDRTRLRDQKAELDQIKDVDNSGQLREFDGQLRQLKAEIEVGESALTDYTSKYQRQSHQLQQKETELSRLMQQQNNRLAPLGRINQDARRVVEWYSANKHLFRGPIKVPLLEIRLYNRNDAKFVEATIPPNDLECFICNYKEDEDNLHKLTAQALGRCRINTSTLNRDRLSISPVPRQLHRFGFTKSVAELFDCHENVKQYLLNMKGLDRIPVGDDGGDLKGAIPVAQSLGIRSLLHKDERVSVSKSKYSGHTITNFGNIGPARWLNDQCADANAIPECERVIEAIKKDVNMLNASAKPLQEKLAALAEKKQAIAKEREELSSKTRHKDRLKIQIREKEVRLVEVERGLINLDLVEQKFVEQVKNIMKEKLEICRKNQKIVTEVEGIIKRRIPLALKHAAVSRDLNRKMEARDRDNGILAMKREELKTFERIRDEKRSQTNNLMRECFELMGLKGGINENSNKVAFQEKLIELSDLSDDIAQLENVLSDERGKLRATTEKSRKVVDDYETYKSNLENVTKKMSELMKRDETFLRDANERRQAWIGPLQALIDDISDNFRDFFLKIDCVGEVKLCIPEDPCAFGDYGVDIWIAFRATDELQKLNQSRQSGGERSVTTILYILALQEKAQVPFRVIDEINQGMDPNNEKAVFEMMVQKLDGDEGNNTNLSKAQYFMLTPKLLNDLYYSPTMTIQIIHNGPVAPKPKKWNTSKFINTRKSLG